MQDADAGLDQPFRRWGARRFCRDAHRHQVCVPLGGEDRYPDLVQGALPLHAVSAVVESEDPLDGMSQRRDGQRRSGAHAAAVRQRNGAPGVVHARYASSVPGRSAPLC
eukprot:scaffold2314_cov267-Pinguiococcus_pyrenoidosus.AAC.11